MMIMKRYRKKTDLEIALSPIVSSLGRMPTSKELNRILGGAPSDWGRILKGQQKISGEYHARLKLLKDGIDDAQFKLRAAEKSKKYSERTRRCRLVPHKKTVYNDMYSFQAERIIERKMSGMLFEDTYEGYTVYCDLAFDLYQSGDCFPQTYFEEQILRRDFLNDL
jgi:hypothetical protein